MSGGVSEALALAPASYDPRGTTLAPALPTKQRT